MMTNMKIVFWFALLGSFHLNTEAHAFIAPQANSNTVPADLDGLKIDQKLNSQVPVDLPFVDESGKEVKLSNYLGTRPAILVLAYYECPHLCSMVLNGVGETISKLSKLKAGSDYQIITVSINPKEGPDLAVQKKKNYVDRFLKGNGEGWHFLTGKQDSITKLAEAVGFHYRFDEKTGEFFHAAGFEVLTPQGKISHYFYGIEFNPQDLRLSLVQAAGGEIGNKVDQLLLFCCGVDLSTGKYTASIMRIVQLVCFTIAASLATLIFIVRNYEPKRQA